MFNTKKIPKFSIILISIALIMFVFISINYIFNHLFANIDSDGRIEYCKRINLDKIIKSKVSFVNAAGSETPLVIGYVTGF